MTAHRVMSDVFLANPILKDPGNAGTIVIGKGSQDVQLVSATTETRTLARPTREGVECCVYMKTFAGQVTLTVTGGFNTNGSTTFVFLNQGEFALFRSAFDGTNYYWDLISSSNVGNGAAIPEGSLFVTATTTLAVTKALHAGKIILLAPAAGAGFTSTLPTASGTGDLYRFMTTVTVTSGNNIIDAKVGGSEVISGVACLGGSTSGNFSSASNTNEISMNGSTTGGVIGDYIALRDVAANQWILEECQLNASGVAATPFAHH